MILIEQNGEQMLVESMKGHKGAKVLHRRVPEQPNEFCMLVNGKWKEDTAAREAAERQADILNLGHVGRFDELSARIAELEAIVMVLAPLAEAQIAATGTDES